jgi:3D-(3,5/4)-trihydroxycyclohexane-1,2-dione acylhydrolase (decyclizing)
VPVTETQGGQGALAWDHPLQIGAVGVTGSTAASALARTRTSCSRSARGCRTSRRARTPMFTQAQRIGLNANAQDAAKWHALPVVADARIGLDALSAALPAWKAAPDWSARARADAEQWRAVVGKLTGVREVELPYEGDVIGAVQRSTLASEARDIVVCAAGTLPAELHKLWRTAGAGRLSR